MPNFSPIFRLLLDNNLGNVSSLEVVGWRHYVLGSLPVWTINPRGDVAVIVWRLVERVPSLVHVVDLLVVVRLVLGEVVVGGAVLLYQLHVLQFHRVVVLPRQLVIHLVRIVRDVTDFLDVRGDGKVEASLVERFAEDMLLVIDQLVSTLLP